MSELTKSADSVEAPRIRKPASRFKFPTGILSPIGLLLLWEIAARYGWIEVRFFPAPSTIIMTAVEMAGARLFWTDLGISLQRIAIGFLLGATPGLLLGLAMGLFAPARTVFGLGEASKYVVVAIGVFFLMTINTLAGVMNVPRIYFDVARNLKASRSKIYFTVALPGALPGIFTGLRLCASQALLLLVAAEFVGASEGIGYRIWWSWSVFWVKNMYVGFAVIATIGFILAYSVDYASRRFLPWQGR